MTPPLPRKKSSVLGRLDEFEFLKNFPKITGMDASIPSIPKKNLKLGDHLSVFIGTYGDH